MRRDFCAACDERDPELLEQHHHVPRSAGGSDDEENFITLCASRHGLGHGFERSDVRELTKAGLARAKARGVKLGNRTNLAESLQLGRAAQVAKADTFAETVLPIIREFQACGLSTLRDIAGALNAWEIPTARGGEWSSSTVMRLMDRTAA